MIKNLTTYPLLAIITVVQVNFGMQHEVKHAAQQAADIDGDIQMPQAPAAAAQQASSFAEAPADMQAAGKDAKAAAAEAAAPKSSIVTIHVPGAPEQFNLNRVHFVSSYSYQELIDEQAEHGDTFILARIELQTLDENGKRHIRYGDAHDTLRWLLKRGYPYNWNEISDNERNLLQKNNSEEDDDLPQDLPMVDEQRAPIHAITFYEYDKNKHEEGFKFLCSYQELFSPQFVDSSSYLFDLFSANQNQSKETQECKYEHMINLACCYLNGTYGAPKNHQKSFELFTRVAHSAHESDSREEALYNIGTMYGGHIDSRPDYKKACEYLIPLVEKAKVPKIRAWAHMQLGITFFHGGHGINRNYQLALKHFSEGDQQYLSPSDCANRLNHLGIIYYNGGDGVQQDCAQAAEYFHKTAEQNDNLKAKITGLEWLIKIYNKDNNSLPEAIKCYMLLIQQPHDLEARQKALAALESNYRFLIASGEFKNYNQHRVEQLIKGVDYLTPLTQLPDLAEEPNALFLLGCLYLTGNSQIGRDYHKAINYFIAAAEKEEYPILYLNYFEQLSKEGALKQHYEQVIELCMNLAQSRNNHSAQSALNTFRFIYEQETARSNGNLKKIIEYLTITAQRSSHQSTKAFALYELGERFFAGRDVEINHQKALETLLPLTVEGQAAYPGGPRFYLDKNFRAKALYLLGNIFSSGQGNVNQDYTEALSYYILAAEQTDDLNKQAVARLQLGKLYSCGLGVIKNYAAAEKYLLSIDMQQIEPAVKLEVALQLGNLYASGGYGLAKDNQKAISYLAPVAKINHPTFQQLARQSLQRIEEENKKMASNQHGVKRPEHPKPEADTSAPTAKRARTEPADNQQQ